jgi:hypothetical protein
LEPPTEPPGFRSTDWLFPPACSSICLVVPWALAVAIPATSTAATKIVLRVFISNSLSINVLTDTSMPQRLCSQKNPGARAAGDIVRTYKAVVALAQGQRSRCAKAVQPQDVVGADCRCDACTIFSSSAVTAASPDGVATLGSSRTCNNSQPTESLARNINGLGHRRLLGVCAGSLGLGNSATSPALVVPDRQFCRRSQGCARWQP